MFLTEAANRGSVPTGYDIENSLKVEKANTEYLKRVVSSAGNAKVWCASMWIKRSELDGTNQYWQFFSSMTSDGSGGYSGWPTRIGFFYSADQLWVDSRAGSGNKRLTSLQRLRDTSAWYHIVVMQDTTQSTDTNRTKIYINGTLLLPADLDYDQYPAQNDDTAMNVANSQIVVGAQGDGGYPWSGYIADVHFLDGQSGKTASDFGEYDEDSGIWKPKAYAGAYGTNGFHLKFEDSSNMGLDSSGNGNNLTSNNITAADQATDTPTNNFATLNPLHKYSGTSSHNPTFKEGATRWTTGRAGYWAAGLASIGLTSGKWYFEAQPGTSNTHITSIGWGDESDLVDWAQDHSDTNGFPGENGTNSIGYLGSDTSSSYGNIWLGTGSTSNVNANYTISNIVGVAIDADNGFVYFAKDNTYVNSGNPGSGANGTGGYAFTDTTTTRTGTVFPAVGGYYHTAPTVINVNFGGFTTITISSAATDANGYGTFEYAPPSGYYALCTKNLAEYG